MRLPRTILLTTFLTVVLAAAGSLPAGAQSRAPSSAIPYWTGELVNLNSGKCLDVYNWSKSTSATIDQWTCGNFQANQTWNFTYNGNGTEIQNRNSGLCLTDVGNGGSTPTDLRQQPCSTNLNDQWDISPWTTAGSIHASCECNSDLMDVAGGSLKNGAWVIGWIENDNNNQAWIQN